MCGISALISKKKPVSTAELSSMNNSMIYRGPDGDGIYISEDKKVGFAHRRLSLVDLSENGRQPMTKHNRTIVFNGEIYNYRQLLKELKNKGYSFLSHSDTEVILSAFEEWGIDCLQKFNGAFAFVIYEHNTHDIFVVRDRVGEKPMYYTQTNEYFAFASEIKALATLPGVKLTPNIDTIRTNLIFHFYADKGDTYFNDIFSLRPGHYIKIKNGKLHFYKYWDIQVSDKITYQDEERQIQEDIESIHDLLQDATRIRLSADCEVGSLLSGGIDSSLLSAFAAKMTNYPIKCFTLSVKNHLDEDLEHAKDLVQSIDNLKHIQVDLSNKMFSIENIDRITKHLEEVVLHRVSVYVNTNYTTMRSNGIKAVLNGQGSDEISCGYYNYYDFHHFDEKVFEYNNFSNYWCEEFAFKDFVPKSDTMALIERNLKQNYLPYKGSDSLNSILAFGIKTHLLNILNHEDKFSMAESVECRTVYTDYRLVERLMKIPSIYKIFDGREKYLIRKLGEQFLPKAITKRKKLGYPDFSIGFEREYVDSVINDKGFKKSNLLNQVFNESIFSQVSELPLSLKWKLANIYRFERVFLD